MQTTLIEQLIDNIIDNDIRSCAKLLDSGVDPNGTLDSAGLTPLHFAAQNNRAEIITLLIKAGGNVCAKTHPDQESPLDIAKLHANWPAVDALNLITLNN